MVGWLGLMVAGFAQALPCFTAHGIEGNNVLSPLRCTLPPPSCPQIVSAAPFWMLNGRLVRGSRSVSCGVGLQVSKLNQGAQI